MQYTQDLDFFIVDLPGSTKKICILRAGLCASWKVWLLTLMSHTDSAAMRIWTKAMPFKVVKKSTGSSLLVPVPSMCSTTDWQAGCGVKV